MEDRSDYDEEKEDQKEDATAAGGDGNTKVGAKCYDMQTGMIGHMYY